MSRAAFWAKTLGAAVLGGGVIGVLVGVTGGAVATVDVDDTGDKDRDSAAKDAVMAKGAWIGTVAGACVGLLAVPVLIRKGYITVPPPIVD